MAFEGEALTLKIYNPTSDDKNDFIVVGNTFDQTKLIPQLIKWNDVKSITPPEDDCSVGSFSSTELSSKKRKRQCLHSLADFGCQSRFRSSNGVALPRIKPGTNSPDVSDLFSGLTSSTKMITNKHEILF